ncbi:MAG: hypothetical protein ACT4OS_08885 [Acidimicrobiales bacterium]
MRGPAFGQGHDLPLVQALAWPPGLEPLPATGPGQPAPGFRGRLLTAVVGQRAYASVRPESKTAPEGGWSGRTGSELVIPVRIEAGSGLMGGGELMAGSEVRVVAPQRRRFPGRGFRSRRRRAETA